MDSQPQPPNQTQIPTQDQEGQVVLYQPDSDGEEMEMATTPRGRRGYPESPPLRTFPPSPRYRLVPVSDNMSEMSESTNSPSPERPADLPRGFVPGMNVYYSSSSSDSRDPSVEPQVIMDDPSNETPAQMPPETPAVHYMDTPRDFTQIHTPAPILRSGTPTMRHVSEPPPPPPPPLHPPSATPANFKTESPDIVLLGPPTPSQNQTPQSSSTSPAALLQHQGHANHVSTRRTTRGSLAAAAAAATTPPAPPRAPTPEPGAPVQASITTRIITKDQTWLLPAPQLGVSLAQIVPADVDPPQWMKYTRAPIVWDGKTDAGGKSGKNLVLIGAAAARASVNGRLVTPTRSQSIDADQSPTSPVTSSSALEGLHLLTDFKSDEKPTYSYALMTRFAILGSPYKSLSLAEIYTMIESKFPWFARDESKWRDSIRYNLSSNCWFVKTKRALHQPGVGNLWMVDEASTGGPKRPRKGRGKGSAFTEDDDDDGSGDEPGPSIISSIDGVDPALRSPGSARNGTLMLTFDSKAKVPLDKEAGQRGVTAHASHNLIPRIVTRNLVMDAVDQAFANAPNGQQNVDPREHVVQAINNMPFALSNDDPAEARKTKGPPRSLTTRAAAKGGEVRSKKITPKKTPAPPWMSSANAGNGSEQGIGSGKDEDESDEEEEGHTPDDYWLTDNNNDAADNAAPQPQPNQPGPSRKDDVDMADHPASAPPIRRPSAIIDTSGLQSLSEAALSESQARPAPSFLDAQRAKSPDVLIRGRELSPRMINNVLVRRRQANVLDPDAFLRMNASPAQPLAPPPPPSEQHTTSLVPPTFGSFLASASAGTAGGSGPSQGPGSQPGMFRPAKQRNGDGVPGTQSFEYLHASSDNFTGLSSTGRRPQQLAKLAPAATSSTPSILDGRRISSVGSLNLRIPGTRQTPPPTRRPLTPNRGDGGPTSNSAAVSSPYAPPPDSRKRKHIPQSPDSARVTLNPRGQKVRRVDERRGNHINPMFSVGQAGPSSGLASSSTSGYIMPPPPTVPFRPAGASGTQSGIGFTTPTTNKTFATPLASGTASSSTAPSAPQEAAFGQSGFMFKNHSLDRGLLLTKGGQPPGKGFTAFSSQSVPSFGPRAPSGRRTRDPSRDNMELDSADELSDDGARRNRRGRRSSNRMDTDASDDETAGNAERRNSSAMTRDANLLRGTRPPRVGMFAQAALSRGLPLSVPSTRTESGAPPSSESEQVVSPTSVSRDSPVLAPMAYPVSRGSTESPRLPSINSLLHQSPAPESHNSLPPIQNTQIAPPIPTQAIHGSPLAVSSRASLSATEARERESAIQTQTMPASMTYYGFIMASRPLLRSPTPATPKYAGGDEDDSGTTVAYNATDWRD